MLVSPFLQMIAPVHYPSRRGCERRSMQLKVRNHPVEVRDLSATGIGLCNVANAWPEATLITLVLEFSPGVTLTVRARVMWARGSDLGLRFER
jgi:hypothetical protein